MRRISWLALTTLALSCSPPAWAARKERSRTPEPARTSEPARPGSTRPAEPPGGPFSDVPRGHWAYESIEKVASNGLLPGWERQFAGERPVNRYQMAVILSKMLDHASATHGKALTQSDVNELEKLTLEFADELALLNVKVSTLEDTVSSLKRDVDSIKDDMRGVGARAGIWGTASVRGVMTDDLGPGYGQVFGTPLVGGALPTVGGFERRFDSTNTAATAPLVRYTGGVSGPANPDGPGNPAGSAANPYLFEDRNFLTVSQFSLNFDREFDPGVHFHAQVDINAEGGETLEANNLPAGAGAPVFGGDATKTTGIGTYADGLLAFTEANSQNEVMSRFRRASAGGPLAAGAGLSPFDFDSGRGHSFRDGNLQLNEIYAVWDDVGYDVSTRLGVMAVPLNTEVNGPSRTYQRTITPSIINTKWESLRQVGVDLFQNTEDQPFWWYVGLFSGSGLQNGVARAGTLLSGPTGDYFNIGGLAVVESQAGAALTDGMARSGDGLAGRFPNPLGRATMTDAPQGWRSGFTDEDTLGYYFLVGSRSTEDDDAERNFRWHFAYYDNNGEIRNSAADYVTAADWDAYQLAGDYTWNGITVMGQFYHGESENSSRFDFSDDGILAIDPGFDSRTSVTPFMNDRGTDTESDAWFLLLNYSFLDKGSATIRYENVEDSTGLAALEAQAWTLGLNWQTSDHSWAQLEYISPDSEARSESGVANRRDIQDDLWQLNYRMTF